MTTPSNTRELANLRREIHRHERGIGKRYAPELRRRITEWAEQRRRDGLGWDRLGDELGMAPNTLKRWCGGKAARVVRSRALVPVRVTAEPTDARVRVVSPSGYRAEGLTVAEAAAMLRALG